MFHTNVPGDVLDTFELIGVHFAHVFYNELYGHAKNKFANEGGPSITSVYQDIMVYYHRQMTVQSKVWTNNTMTHIRSNFQKFSEIKLITPTETIIYLANSFIPIKYVNEVASVDKYDIVYSCLSSLVGELINEIVSNYLKMIIDDHDNKKNIGILKDIVVGMLMQIRENFHSKFTKEEIGETRINVDVATAKRMREDVIKTKKLMAKMQEKNAVKDKHLSQLEEDINRKNATIMQLEKSAAELTADNSKYRKTILNLIDKIKRLESDANVMYIEPSMPKQSNMRTFSSEPSKQLNMQTFEPNMRTFSSEPSFEQDMQTFDDEIENEPTKNTSKSSLYTFDAEPDDNDPIILESDELQAPESPPKSNIKQLSLKDFLANDDED